MPGGRVRWAPRGHQQGWWHGLLAALWLVACGVAMAQSPPGSQRSAAVDLSATERAYLDELGPVRLVVDPDWEPFELLGPEGEFTGIAADLVRLIAGRAGVEVEIVPTATWTESLETARWGGAHGIAFLNQTPERSEWLVFTRPYFTDPQVFITRNEHDFIADPSTLSGESIAIPRGTMVEERVRRDYPNLEVILVETEAEAFAAVDQGRADMALRSLTVAAYTIRKEGWFNLKVAGRHPGFANEFRIGLLHGHEPLRDILDRGIATITPADTKEIVNRHVPITFEAGADVARFLKAIGLLAVVAAAVGLWAFQLRRMNRKLAAHEAELEAMAARLAREAAVREQGEQRLRAVLDHLPLGVIVADKEKGVFAYVNDAICAMLKYSPDQLLGKGFLDIHPEAVHDRLHAEFGDPGRPRPFVVREVEMLRNDGTTFLADIHPTDMELDGGACTLALFSDATERKEAQEQLDREAGLRELLVDLTATFITAAPDTLDSLIDGALERLGHAVNADRAYVFSYDFEAGIATNTHEWAREGISPEIDNLQDVLLSMFPSWPAKHRRDEVVMIPDVSREPMDGVRALLDAQDVKSVLAVPLNAGGECLGFVGFDSVRAAQRYSETDERLLRVFAQVLATVMMRLRAERDYQTIFHEMLDGMAIHEVLVDDDGRPVDYRYLEVNPAFERLTGLVATQVVGRTVLELLPDTEPIWIEQFGHVALTGEPMTFSHYSRELGKHFEVTAFRPRERQFACIFQDITERVEAEKTLQQSEEKFRSLADTAKVMICIVAGADGTKCLYTNSEWRRVHGYSKEEALRIRPIDTVAPEYRQQVLDNAAKRIEGRPSPDSYELEIITKSGDRKWLEFSSTAIDFENQKAFLTSSIDITGRKQAEAERESLQSQLSQAQKMESIGQLAGGVAHDFNNMLSAIIGHAELAREGVRPGGQADEDLHEVLKAAHRSAHLTRQLLAFARREVISPRPMDLNAQVEGTLGMLRRLIGEQIELRWEPAPDLWTTCLDASQVDQVLTNLCVNARDAITGTGTVTVATGNAPFDAVGARAHADCEPGDFVRVSVADDGSGMDAETLERVFEPFFTTKDVGKGTGLGLATVYGIARQSHGFVAVDSAVGRGTRIDVFFPRHEGAGPVGEPAPAEAAPRHGHRAATVLVAEDEPAILKLAALALRRQGHTVIEAPTPHAALDAARAHDGAIDLLLTDVVMPGMDGSELARALAAIHPAIRVLFMSGYPDDVVGAGNVVDGETNFIAKPFTVRGLARKVAGILGREA